MFVMGNASYIAAVLEPAFCSRYQVVPESLVRVLTRIYTTFPLGQAVPAVEAVRPAIALIWIRKALGSLVRD